MRDIRNRADRPKIGAMRNNHSRSASIAALRFLAFAAALGLPVGASAQRASENALSASSDAFGTSIGRETIGLYGPYDVRGFSTLDAGNVRIDGLFFDAITLPGSLQRQSTVIRVGISAQGFAFPAPTGVVDVRLRRAGNRPEASGFASVDELGFLTFEATGDVPLRPNLAAAIGVGAYREAYINGTRDQILAGSLTLSWQPLDTLSITPFASYARTRRSETPPVYITVDGQAPPRIRRRKFPGPGWALNERDRVNAGTIARWTSGALDLQAGLFRSVSDAPATFANLYVAIQPDGRARQIVVADPPASYGSTSGEIRIDRTFKDTMRRHRLTLSARGRSRLRLFGGSDTIDLGDVRLGQAQPAPRPDFAFGPRDRDQVREIRLGFGYGLLWPGVAELSLGAQKSFYRKTDTPAGAQARTIRARPILLSAAGSLQVATPLALYGSYSEGLEDSGSAPSSASNRNAPLDASRTRQIEVGARLVIAPKLRLVGGLFELSKPYFQFDSANLFRRLGSLRNRGLEVSLSGSVTPRLDLLAGAVISSPKVRGDATRNGIVGSTPVGFPARRGNVAIDWRPEPLPGITLTAGFNHQSKLTATNRNDVTVPGRNTFDIGARYATKLSGAPAQLRVQISNLTNVYALDVYGSGVFDVATGRTALVSVGIDL